MSNAYTNNQTAGEPAPLPGVAEAGCQANDLKGLLNAIVAQISEADRRHSDSLQQMQERLANLGRDARSMRSRVPDQFQSAFDRIEAGMGELAARIAEEQHANVPFSHLAATPEENPPSHRAPVFPAETQDPYFTNQPAPTSYAPDTSAHVDEEPMALRSAQPAPASVVQPRVAKPAQAVDTFDVIESLPGDVTDPWDRDAANALASVYDAEPRTFPQDPYGAPMTETPRVYAPGSAPAAAAAPAVDQGWLEKRFAEISGRIEESLADIRPDQSFFALGQRLDQFERSFAQAFDNVATKNDVESVRLIEAHMMELVGHLENTQNHMARIDTIEEQLAAIAQRLSEVHDLAASASAMPESPSAPHIDVAAVARAAAQEAASEAAARFMSTPQEPAHVAGIDDVRRLMEQSISNARQSEENTVVLLDTLQQAMIRLLDRMDAIELNQHQAGPARPAGHGAHDGAAFGTSEYRHSVNVAEPQLPYPPRNVDPEELDAAIEAVGSTPARQAPGRPAPAAASEFAEPSRREPRAAPQAPSASAAPQPEKLRQDFIADARRAKLRLSGDDGDAIVLPAPAPKDAPAAAAGKAPRAGKPKPSAAAATGESKSASVLSPRVVALSVALALAGAAYVMIPHGRSNKAPPEAAPVAAATEPSGQGAGEAETRMTQKSAPSEGAPGAAGGNGDAPPPEADFSKPPASKSGKDAPAQLNIIEGKIVPGDMTTGSAARPLHGIAVASSETLTPEQLSKLQRDQAMANVSSRLGEAAAPAAPASRISLDANNPDSQPQGVLPQRSESSALDMPPATVGPLSLRLAAANGDPSAQFEVGARLAEGKGTDQSFKDAAKWYQRSASQGFAQAQYRLGTLYERGLGLKADEARAKEWYLRAAEQGNMKAMHNLAVLSANAKSGTPDYATAAKWFQDAAERGLADSQFNLAVLYENGLGVDGDMRQAYKWLSLAARGGDKEATRRRDIMKGKLSAAELAESDAMIRTFHIRQSDMMINDARTAGEAWKRNPANGENG